MGIEGGGVTQLTHNTSSDKVPTWSPDGSQIAFRSDRGGNSEIYVMNARWFRPAPCEPATRD